MRTNFASMAMLLLFGSGTIGNIPERSASHDAVQESPLGCLIRTWPTCELGKVPEIAVAITNQTSRDIYLVGSLDASDCQWRYPYCYFEVIGPDGKSAVQNVGRCGNMNELREKDFVKVPPGGAFDPYQDIDDHGFFGAYQQMNPPTFRKAGEYRIRFVYSTTSDTIGEWFGSATYEKLVGLLRRVPKVEVRSNEIRVRVVERTK